MKFILLATVLLTSFTIGKSASAQNWDHYASFYIFAAETNTDIGGNSATLSFSDALENLDATFMGSYSADNGQWGFAIDYMMTDVGFGTGIVDASVKTQILTGYLSYKIYDTDTVRTDLLAGARWFDTDTTVTIGGISRSLADDWTDPVIGARARFGLGGNWSGTVLGDYGGSSGRETWQILLSADYAFNEHWSGRVGYRQISVSNNDFADSYKFEQKGPVFGVTYKF